jgi:2-keto-4-pentenoate hydratase/2-oxohepta-3-ene-1,7-dioic acid hydratase in catechol pathway
LTQAATRIKLLGMKLVTYQDQNSAGAHIGALRNNTIVPLDSVAPSMLALIDMGADGLAKAKHAVANAKAVVPASSVKLLAPIPRPRQNVICVGLNYALHAAEGARARGVELKLPSHPVFFTKGVNAVCGPNDEVPLDPNVTKQLDYEIELAFVIGKTGKNIKAEDALGYIFGYTVVNDISAREVQSQHQQFFKGKSLDRTCPVGPCIVTSDEIADPGKLGLRLRVNGETRQDSNTNDLIFNIPTLIAQLSLGMTIEAGTIVSTGTPSGVALGMTPPIWLKPGDVMEAEVDGIGVLTNKVVADRS